MSDSNTIDFTNPSTFILLGIPGLEMDHVWISIPFCAIYIIAILGNFTILFIVKMEPSLCLTQMYFILSFSVMESGIFVAMALDRYVAICDPLRHSTTLTNSLVAKIGLAVVLRGIMLIVPYPVLVRRWPYCRTNIIPHSYCEYMAVVKLACADIRISSYYGLLVTFLVIALDVFFIAMSYIQILRSIFSLPTKNARLKTFGTCASHLCAILASYVPFLFSFLTHRLGHNVPLYFHVLMANTYLLVPPMLNPIIYGVRTKQIWGKVLWLFTQKGT